MESSQTITLDELVDEFESLGDWEAQCEFLIELGFELPKLPVEAKTEANRVHGCQSNVWLITELKGAAEPVVVIQAESDAMLVNGLIAVVLAVFSGKTPAEILTTDVQTVFAQLGLDRHLSSARRNGLYGMVTRIQQLAKQAV